MPRYVLNCVNQAEHSAVVTSVAPYNTLTPSFVMPSATYAEKQLQLTRSKRHLLSSFLHAKNQVHASL